MSVTGGGKEEGGEERDGVAKGRWVRNCGELRKLGEGER